MRYLLFVGLCVVLPVFGLRAQLLYDLPGKLGLNHLTAQDYLKNQLEKEELSDAERANFLCMYINTINAIGGYNQAASLMRMLKITDDYATSLKARIYLTKAKTYKFIQKPDSADLFFRKAFEIGRKEKNDTIILESLIEWAEFFRKFQGYDLSKRKLEEAEKIISRHSDLHELDAFLNNRWAAWHNEKLTPKTSLSYSYAALAGAKKVGNDFMLAISYNELGYSHAHIDAGDSAIYYYTLAKEKFNEVGMYVDMINAWRNRLSFVFSLDRKNQKVIDEYLELIDYVEDNDIPMHLGTAYLHISEVKEAQGNYAEALSYFHLFHSADHEFFIANSNREMEQIRRENEKAKAIIENQQIKLDLQETKNVIDSKNRTIYIWVTAFMVLIIFAGIIFWSYRNSNRLYQQVKKQNEEKDVLIQEVHHRVKNNLNFIHSLLEMEENSLSNPNDAKILQQSSLRISSLSLVHEMLYTDNQEGMVWICEYLKDLGKLLLNSHLSKNQAIETIIKAESYPFDVQKATAIGLLVTECFTNSVKHAFSEVYAPEFHVKFTIDEDKNLGYLEISDNGKVVIKPEELPNKSSFGMRLINIFSRQLNGEYSIEINRGFTYKINFPLK